MSLQIVRACPLSKTLTSQQRYIPFTGHISSSPLTGYTYTGQYSYAADVCLLTIGLIMKKGKKIFLGIVATFLLTSCSKNSDTPIAISNSIEIAYSPSSEMEVGNQMEAILINKTKHCIQFPLVDGLEIYATQNGTWVKVPSLVTILGDQNLYLEPKGKPLSRRSIDIQPDISSLEIQNPTSFRVLLTGHLCDDESIKIEKEIPFTVGP